MFKVLITVTRYVQREGYESSEMAQADDYYFSTQAKAKAFCQQYAAVLAEVATGGQVHCC